MPILVHDGSDKQAWRKARTFGIGASGISEAMTPSGRRSFMEERLFGEDPEKRARLQAYSDYGTKREEEFIGQWIERRFGIPPNKALWAHDDNARHMATPDGYDPEGNVLAEFKTTTKQFRTIPRKYRDQMEWQMYVMGAPAVLFVQEPHQNFTPIGMPLAQWYYPEEGRIERMVSVANAVLFELDMERADA